MRRALDEERERLRAVERVAAWKETARRVAHEVKNPLAPIRLTVENLIKARAHAPERFDRMFDEGAGAILDEVARLQRVVSEFSAYARLPEPDRRSCDLAAIVDSVTALHAGDGRAVIRRMRDAGSAVLPIEADADLIGQALRNLVDNALREARAHGGEVVVRTGTDAGAAVVEVRDHGAGFGDVDPAGAFEPYVSRREGGTGLGLAIAQRIAVDHGGVIRARNADDGAGGAVVTMRLPLRRGDTRP
jgi:nitrogen fixation/metabolism regulation signal transduction histidine kinase